MGVIRPAPDVLGACSLTVMVEMICFVHLVICIVILANVSSVQTSVFGHMTFTPLLQCIIGAWCLFGIPLIVIAAFGTLYRLEDFLHCYIVYLSLTLVFAVAVLVSFISAHSVCLRVTGHPEVLMTCNIIDGFILFGMIIALGCLAFATYFVWSCRCYLLKRTETELLRYADTWQTAAALACDIQAEHFRQMNAQLALSKKGKH